MTVLAQLRHGEARAYEAWNGTSNVFPPIDGSGAVPANDYRTYIYDDSAWLNPILSPSTPVPTNLKRYDTTATRHTPDLDIGSEGVIASTSAHGSGVIRWYFNPGAGPFTGAEFCWGLDRGGSGAFFLNYDGDTQGGVGSFQIVFSTNLPAFSDSSTFNWVHWLQPNTTNLLVVRYATTSYISLGFRFGAAAGESIILSTAGAEKTFPVATTAPTSWQGVTFDDSTWSNSVTESVSLAAFYTPPNSAAWVTDPARNGDRGAGAEFLARRTWIVPEDVNAGTLEINVDDGIGNGALDFGGNLYLNGHQLTITTARSGSPPFAPYVVDIPAAYFSPGVSNVLAIDIYSQAGEVALSYKLTAIITLAIAPAKGYGWCAVIG